MTSWMNYGICVTDDTTREKIIHDLEELGIIIVGETAEGIVATQKSRSEVPQKDLKQILLSYEPNVSGFIQVSANDTSDSATGTIYSVTENNIEKMRTESSGGESTRRNWFGVSYNGVTVDGNKYY